MVIENFFLNGFQGIEMFAARYLCPIFLITALITFVNFGVLLNECLGGGF